jgi:hypothetical protein
MSRNRYVAIKAQLAFVPDRVVSEEEKASPAFDRLWRIRPLLEALQDRFQFYASPSVVVTLDEMMVQMSGCVAHPAATVLLAPPPRGRLIALCTRVVWPAVSCCSRLGFRASRLTRVSGAPSSLAL